MMITIYSMHESGSERLMATARSLDEAKKHIILLDDNDLWPEGSQAIAFDWTTGIVHCLTNDFEKVGYFRTSNSYVRMMRAPTWRTFMHLEEEDA